MTKWEYCFVTLHRAEEFPCLHTVVEGDEVEVGNTQKPWLLFNALGSRGWELVAITENVAGRQMLDCIFKREVT